jgi:hypothetical protein
MGGDITWSSSTRTADARLQLAAGVRPGVRAAAGVRHAGGVGLGSLRIVAGLDTYGIRKAVEAAQNGAPVDAVDVLDGLFFKTVATTAPRSRWCGCRRDRGGCRGQRGHHHGRHRGRAPADDRVLLERPQRRRQFRVSEFLHAALNNPLCLFTVSGRLSLFLRVYITLGVSIFSVSFSFTLADVTLLDFSVAPDCEPPPPKLGGTVGDTWWSTPGSSGTTRSAAPPGATRRRRCEKETVKVISCTTPRSRPTPRRRRRLRRSRGRVLGERREYLDPGLKRVVVDGAPRPSR